MTSEYADNVRAYSKDLASYMSEFNMHIRNKTIGSEDAILMLKEGIIFASENSNLQPQNKADKVLDEYMFSTNYYFKQVFEYSLQLATTKDKMYANLASDALDNYNQEISIVRELLVKYGVNN